MKLDESFIIQNYGYNFNELVPPPDSVLDFIDYSLLDDTYFYQIFVWKNSLYTVGNQFAIYRIKENGK